MRELLTLIFVVLISFCWYSVGKLEVRKNLQEEVKNSTEVNPKYIIELRNDSIIIFRVSDYYSEDKMPINSKEEFGNLFILVNQ